MQFSISIHAFAIVFFFLKLILIALQDEREFSHKINEQCHVWFFFIENEKLRYKKIIDRARVIGLV